MTWEDFRRNVASSGGVHQANYETMLAGSSDEQRQQIHQGQAKYLWNSAVDAVRLATLASGAQSAFGQEVINEKLDSASFDVPTDEVERAGYYGAMALDIAIAIPQAGRGAYTLSRSGYGAYKAWSAGRALRGAADGLAAVGRAGLRSAVRPERVRACEVELVGLGSGGLDGDARRCATRRRRALFGCSTGV